MAQIETSMYRQNPLRSVADYEADYLQNDLRAQSIKQNALALETGQMGLQDRQRALQDQGTLRNALAGLGANATDEARVAALKGTGLPGGFAQADALEKSMLERQKTGAEVKNKDAATLKLYGEAQAESLKRYRSALDYVDTQQGAQRWLQAQYADPVIGQYMAATLGPLEQAVTRIPGDPQAFQQWRQQAAMGMERHMEQKRLEATQQETARHNKTTEGLTASGHQVTMRGQDITARGQNLTDARERDPTLKQSKAGPMSVTLQKELIESDEALQMNQSVKATLEAALKLNNTAYSGYGAKTRAMVRSNILGESKEANATIDLDNMMTGQALESLKAVFGGMPTEGERKILLDMQASADKTPTQRETIIKRAIAAADRRAGIAGAKAKSIRDGTYLTEGAPMPAAPASAGPFTDAEKERRYQEWKAGQGK